PLSVISHLHMPMARWQVHMTMPFIIMAQLHMPPENMLHRLCIMLVAMASSQTQVIFRPPLTFCILSLHWGTITQFAWGMVAGVDIPMPGAIAGIVAGRSIIMLAIVKHSMWERERAHPGMMVVRKTPRCKTTNRKNPPKLTTS